MGSGIRNINKYLEVYSGGKPEFHEKDIFTLIVPLTTKEEKSKKENVGINVGIKLNKTQKTIVEAIKNNPQCTIDEIAKTALVEKRTIERNIKALKERGIIERIGSRKDGSWIIKI